MCSNALGRSPFELQDLRHDRHLLKGPTSPNPSVDKFSSLIRYYRSVDYEHEVGGKATASLFLTSEAKIQLLGWVGNFKFARIQRAYTGINAVSG